jgi:hypothetical protein
MKRFVMLLGLTTLLIYGTACAEQTLVASKAKEPPVIDGDDSDPAWAAAKEIITHDKIANIDIRLKALYADSDIYLLAKFPDVAECRTHKSWVWDKEMEIYVEGNDREDIFQFMWSMKDKPVDLSVYADNDYTADVWYWKALRTDPIGFADDKVHYFAATQVEKVTKIVSKTGKIMYLFRSSDEGVPAFKSVIYEKYQGNMLPRFINQQPSGSLADIKAKGAWQGGWWVIEFKRALNTGYGDDVQFDINKEYIFGVSRFEITGRKNPELELDQPLYACGDVGEVLKLIFEKK